MRALRLGQRRMLRGMGGNWGSDRDEDEVGRKMGWRLGGYGMKETIRGDTSTNSTS